MGPVLSFGRFKNVPLGEVPRNYLAWALKNVTGLSPELRGAMAARLGLANPPRVVNVGSVREAGSAKERPAARPGGRRAGAPRRLVVSTVEAPEAALCAICGLGGSAGRPLVHEACVADRAAGVRF